MSKKEISEKTIQKRISSILSSNKFLREEKYFKTNVCLVAHYQSDVAREAYCSICSKKGGASYSVYNKRKGKLFHSEALVFEHICNKCLEELEKGIGRKPFDKFDHCP